MKSEKQRKVPNSRRNLDMSLQRLYGAGANLVQVRMAMANTIVGQMLPDVVIKGGTSLRLRYGRGASRYTIDCDVARRGDWGRLFGSSPAELCYNTSYQEKERDHACTIL